MKILVTGASGFIGSFIVEKGLTEGHVIWAGMRATSSRNYLQDSRIRFVELDMEHPEILRPQLAACKAEFGGWDVIVHAAGATKCIRREDFFRTNTEGTRHFVDARHAERGCLGRAGDARTVRVAQKSGQDGRLLRYDRGGAQLL